MTPADRHLDRRTYPRREATELAVSLRLRGQLSRCAARVIDFNRFGMAVLTDRPLAKDRRLFITLRWCTVHLDNVVGVVHNCIPQNPSGEGVAAGNAETGGYRSGIQFRTRSELQLDQNLVEAELMRLERALAEADRAAAVEAG